MRRTYTFISNAKDHPYTETGGMITSCYHMTTIQYLSHVITTKVMMTTEHTPSTVSDTDMQ